MDLLTSIGRMSQFPTLVLLGGIFPFYNYNRVCPRLEFDNNMFINCLGYDFYIYGAFEFYAIPLLINDVMYDITTIP